MRKHYDLETLKQIATGPVAPKAPRRRALGQITGDLEPLLQELTDKHEMQWHEILGLIHAYLVVHCPQGQETYTADGDHPVFYYGPRGGLK